MRNGWRPASEARCLVHDFEQIAKARSRKRRDAAALQRKAENYKQPNNKG